MLNIHSIYWITKVKSLPKFRDCPKYSPEGTPMELWRRYEFLYVPELGQAAR